jgi:hypothetical protein
MAFTPMKCQHRSVSEPHVKKIDSSVMIATLHLNIEWSNAWLSRQTGPLCAIGHAEAPADGRDSMAEVACRNLMIKSHAMPTMVCGTHSTT